LSWGDEGGKKKRKMFNSRNVDCTYDS